MHRIALKEYVRLLLVLGEYLRVKLGEQRRDILSGPYLVADHVEQLFIGPEYTAGLVKDRVRDLQLLIELSLNVAVIDAEAHQLQHQCLAFDEEHDQHDDHVQPEKDGRANAGAPVDRVFYHGKYGQKDRQYQCPSEYALYERNKYAFVVHF